MITAVGALVFAVALMSVGRWGRRNAAALVPSTYSPHTRAKEERSLRRGARSVTALGVLFAVLGVLIAAAAAFGTTR